MPLNFVRFKHARFSARFPDSFRYSRSHYWMPPLEGEVSPGDNIGWVEGFKAASDVYCVMQGRFAGGNPILQEDACIVRSDPYEVGWLYAVRGEPEPDSLDVQGYVDYLAATIQRMAETTHADYKPGAEEE